METFFASVALLLPTVCSSGSHFFFPQHVWGALTVLLVTVCFLDQCLPPVLEGENRWNLQKAAGDWQPRWEWRGLIWDQWPPVYASSRQVDWLTLSGIFHFLKTPSGRCTARRCERTSHFLSWKPSAAVPEAVWTHSRKAGAAQPLERRAKKTWKVRKETQAKAYNGKYLFDI